jgi:hypothetical protein
LLEVADATTCEMLPRWVGNWFPEGRVNAYVWVDCRVVLIPNVDKLKSSGQLGDVIELRRGSDVVGYVKVSEQCFVTVGQSPVLTQPE